MLKLEPAEWAALIVAMGLVIVAEMLNTVVEVVVDLASPEIHPLAKVAKDVAAGAVLLAAFVSIAVGAALFLPKLL